MNPFQELISKWIDPNPERKLDESHAVTSESASWSANMYHFLRQSKTRIFNDIGDNISSSCGSEIPNDVLEVSSVTDFPDGRAEI
jgi:hypothetical protein